MRKQIPPGAGLGGGSSDAAAALVAANLGWKLGLDREQLMGLAGELGSDVPFFLAGRAAVCRGRGDQVTPVHCPTRLHFVIVCPSEGISTAQVYGRLGDIAAPPRSSGPAVEALRRGDLHQLARGMVNRLEESACEMVPSLRQFAQRLRQPGVVGQQMTGSGSAFFGICRCRSDARRIAGRLGALRLGHVFPAMSTEFPILGMKAASRN